MVKLFGKSKKKEEDPSSIDAAFQSVLEEIGVPESEKKHLMTMDIARKQQLTQSYQSKLIAKKEFGTKSKKKSVVSQSPQYFVDGLKAEPTKELLTCLRVRLGNQPLKWLREFINIEGVSLLIKVLIDNEIKQVKNQEDIYKIAQCLHSLKLIMNTKMGLDSVMKIPNSINSICLTLDTSHLKTKIMISELLTALCIVHGKGHALVLSGMDNYREVKRERKPFLHLIQGLKNTSGSLQSVTFGLINTLISCSTDVNERTKIRSQFKKIGLVQIIQELEPEYANNPDLATQRDLYEQESRWDEQEIIESVRGDVSDDNPESIFRAIRERTHGEPHSPAFVSILKLLLKSFSEDDSTGYGTSLSNYLFIEKILNKINGGEVITDDLGEFFGGGMEINHVSGEKAVLIQKEIEDLKKQKKKDSEKLHEKDILVTKLAKRLKRLEEAVKKGGLHIDEEDSFDIPDFEGDGFDHSPSKIGDKPTISKTAPAPKKDLSFNTVKAPNESSNFLSGIETEAASASGAPIPGGPGGPPPPPPPPGKMAPATPQLCSRPPNVKLKSYQWSKYRTRNVQNTFWKMVDHAKYSECLPYEQIEFLFAAAVIEKKEKELKKGSEVTVIDPKRAQNVGILLSRFKNFNLDQIRDAIINLDDSILDLETINQLVKYIPSKEELDAIKSFKSAQESVEETERMRLGKAEVFFDKLADIPRLAQRIQALHFKLNFPEKLYQAKPDIRKFNEGLSELQNNNIMSIMELVLSIGNFINFGTNRGNASGFAIDSINKLADTKSNVREKYSLVHYIIELLEKTQPKLLDFPSEIPNVIEAATLSYNQSCNEIKLLRAGLVKLQKEMFGDSNNSANQNNDEDDSGGEKPQPINEPLKDDDPLKAKLSEFLLASKTEISDAEKLISETEALYQKVAKFYGEEPGKVPPEEFLAIFKRFTDTFVLSLKDIERENAMKERADKRKQDKKSSDKKKKEILSKLKKVASPNGSSGSSKSTDSPASSVSSQDDEDEEAIREYIKAIKDQSSPSSRGDSSETEGMMDDVLNLIRDGDFRTIRRNHLSKKGPKPKRSVIDKPTRPKVLDDTPSSTYSSVSSIYDAEPLDISDEEEDDDEIEEDEDESNDEYDDDDIESDDDEEEDDEQERNFNDSDYSPTNQ
ncbi:hypothetical protein CYY_006634 [Polysphondylium violaceum]|uniref:Actin binding protein n=1 Tax=Polysphondylium violaceum TaxID=133409 RepID=A0A8J4V5P7_9MYCE|nr:hypothetical protein CYY_006634 [Polysphondylium violaceum]